MGDNVHDVTLNNQCPYCGEVMEIDSHLRGEMVTCSNQECGQAFRISVPQGHFTQQDGAASHISKDRLEESGAGTPHSDETELFRVHPAFIRRRPFKALGMALIGLLGMVALLAGFGVGLGLAGMAGMDRLDSLPDRLLMSVGGVLIVISLLSFFWWWLVTVFTTVTVTTKRTIHRVGIISRDSSEVQHDDVRNLQIDQSILQRILGIGDIAISSSGQDDMEIVAVGVPDPEQIAKVVRKYQ